MSRPAIMPGIPSAYFLARPGFGRASSPPVIEEQGTLDPNDPDDLLVARMLGVEPIDQSDYAEPVPGSLRPRAIAVIAILDGSPQRTLSAGTLAKRLGETARMTLPLLRDMEALGLLERLRAPRSAGSDYHGAPRPERSNWRLQVSGPSPKRAPVRRQRPTAGGAL